MPPPGGARGAIRAFPRRRGTGRPYQGWRGALAPGTGSASFRREKKYFLPPSGLKKIQPGSVYPLKKQTFFGRRALPGPRRPSLSHTPGTRIRR